MIEHPPVEDSYCFGQECSFPARTTHQTLDREYPVMWIWEQKTIPRETVGGTLRSKSHVSSAARRMVASACRTSAPAHCCRCSGILQSARHPQITTSESRERHCSAQKSESWLQRKTSRIFFPHWRVGPANCRQYRPPRLGYRESPSAIRGGTAHRRQIQRRHPVARRARWCRRRHQASTVSTRLRLWDAP